MRRKRGSLTWVENEHWGGRRRDEQLDLPNNTSTELGACHHWERDPPVVQLDSMQGQLSKISDGEQELSSRQEDKATRSRDWHYPKALRSKTNIVLALVQAELYFDPAGDEGFELSRGEGT